MTTTNPDNLTLIESLSPEERDRLVKALKQNAIRIQEPPIHRRSPDDGPAPLSFTQQRLWLLDQLNSNRSTYIEHRAMRFRGTLDVPSLHRALTEIVRRHEALRTFFPVINGNPAQIIAPPQAVTLLIHDLSGIATSRQEPEVQKFVDDTVRNPFDLAQLPLIRMTLFRLGERLSLLLITAHHIVFDGWSIGLFRYEMAELYNAFLEGRGSPLPELPIQYADFAIWQRRRMQAGTLEPQLRYWTQQLVNLPPLLQLPVSRQRPEIESFGGARVQMHLRTHLSAELKAFSRRENVTLFMTLLASFQTLLYRYTDQTDIPVGTVIANRTPDVCEQLIGCFVNTLVLRGDLKGDLSFRKLVRRVSDVAIAAYEHQELPFECLVDALQPERSASYNPLFQFMFILQNVPSPPIELPEMTIVAADVDGGTAKFDLTLSMEETPAGLDGTWEYNDELFDSDTIQRMSTHFQTLLTAIVKDPDRPIGMLPLLDNSEREQVIEIWNGTAHAYPQQQCIHQLIEEQVQRTPEAIALTDGERHLSYRDLNSQANKLAHYLQGLEVGPEKFVGMCLPRSVDAIVGLLGVLKAGGAFVPLDPTYPRQRLTRILNDVNPTVMLVQAGSELPERHGLIFNLDSDWPMIAGQDEESPKCPVTPDNLAYVIYTSGSTGKPKGVMVSHRNLVNSTTARWYYYREPVTAFLLLSALAFDSSMAGVFWTLTQGGTLVVPEDDAILDMPRLSDLVAKNQVSHVLSVPSLYDEILEEARPEQLTSLRTVILAGESCPPKVIEQHRQKIPQTEIFNEYGPTETTVWSTVHRLEPGLSRTRISIGRPIANTQLYILDASLQPVPIGVPGELHIAGEGVARGYLNSPELTAERFIADPFSKSPGARLYKTGDRARYLADGKIELLGRFDQQVKLRGFRVELSEIESALRQHPAIGEAAAFMREEQKTARLVACVSVSSGIPVTEEELRDFLRGQLPGYAVPLDFVFLDLLPRLSNGKIDRTRLSLLDFHLEREIPSALNWSELEQSLACIWQETLQIKSVGRNDDFFKIGGDSLSMVRVYNRLRKITDKKISITDLFKNPTIASLARFVGRS
jgi:amino acid adenylation domain-containing protein